MNINKLCPICGGYIGVVNYLSSSSNPPIRFCPGHSTTDADLAGHFSIMCTGVGPELYTLPPRSSVYPHYEETLWKIAEGVATDSTYPTDTDIHDVPSTWVCPFCRGESIGYTDEFPHSQDCIVIKARELMEWRKAQPRIEVKMTKPEVPRD